MDKHKILRTAVFLMALCLIITLAAGCQSGQSPTTNTNSSQSSVLPITQEDGDKDGIYDYIEDQLAERFAPVVKLHPDERYLPANILWYMNRVRMRFDVSLGFDEQVLELGAVSLFALCAQSCRGQVSGLTSSPTDFFLEQTDSNGGDNLDSYRQLTRQGTDPSGWVCYAHVRLAPAEHQGMYDVQYIFFYPYNGDMAWGPFESGHEADYEHVTVRVEDDLQTIHRIYYSAHDGEGRWYALGTSLQARDGYCLTSDGKPIVYSALDSHASYPWAGKWIRSWIQKPDDFVDDGGFEWGCKANVTNLGEKLYPREGMQWLQYSGHWGEIGEVRYTTSPSGPAYQSWWDADPLAGD